MEAEKIYWENTFSWSKNWIWREEKGLAQVTATVFLCGPHYVYIPNIVCSVFSTLYLQSFTLSVRLSQDNWTHMMYITVYWRRYIILMVPRSLNYLRLLPVKTSKKWEMPIKYFSMIYIFSIYSISCPAPSNWSSPTINIFIVLHVLLVLVVKRLYLSVFIVFHVLLPLTGPLSINIFVVLHVILVLVVRRLYLSVFIVFHVLLPLTGPPLHPGMLKYLWVSEIRFVSRRKLISQRDFWKAKSESRSKKKLSSPKCRRTIGFKSGTPPALTANVQPIFLKPKIADSVLGVWNFEKLIWRLLEFWIFFRSFARDWCDFWPRRDVCLICFTLEHIFRRFNPRNEIRTNWIPNQKLSFWLYIQKSQAFSSLNVLLVKLVNHTFHFTKGQLVSVFNCSTIPALKVNIACKVSKPHISFYKRSACFSVQLFHNPSFVSEYCL